MGGKLKIYFCGSIRGGRQDADLYARLIEQLKTYGDVLTEHVGDTTLSAELGERMTPEEIFEKDMNWMKETDIVVAEVTQPSLGVGFELGLAVSMKKPTLCLFRPESGKALSGLIRGIADNKRYFVSDYEEKDAQKLIKDFIAKFHTVDE